MKIAMYALLTVAFASASWAQQVSASPDASATALSGPASERLPRLTSPVRLTPDLAACLAVKRSTAVALDQEQIAAAQANVLLAEAQRGLRVEAQASYTRTGPTQSITLPDDMGGGEISFSPGESHRESLLVTKPLYLGRRDRYSRQAAEAGVAVAEHGQEAGIVDLAFAARQAVFALLRLQQLAVVSQQRLTAVVEHLRISRAMFEAGTVPRFEVVQAETEQSRARGDVIRSQTAVAQQRASIAQLLNVPQGTEIEAEEGVPAVLPAADLEDLIATAFRERAELDALLAAVRVQEANLRLAQANDNPALSFQGSLNRQTATAGSSEINWNLTVALTKPIFQGGETRARIEAAKAALRAAELQVERVQQQIALEVSQAVLNVREAREQLQVAEQGEVEAQERARIAVVRFQNGVSLGVEVIDAQTALAAAQTEAVNAAYGLQIAVTALRSALGLADLPKESIE